MSEVQERVAANVVTSDNLAEFTARKLGLVDAQPEATEAPADEGETQVADEPENQADQSDSDGEGNEATVEDDQKERKANPKIERRFSEITKQREAARAKRSSSGSPVSPKVRELRWSLRGVTSCIPKCGPDPD